MDWLQLLSLLRRVQHYCTCGVIGLSCPPACCIVHAGLVARSGACLLLLLSELSSEFFGHCMAGAAVRALCSVTQVSPRCDPDFCRPRPPVLVTASGLAIETKVPPCLPRFVFPCAFDVQ